VIDKIKRAFKWAVSGLRQGRADVRESEPVKPAPEAFVDAIRPRVSRQVWAMVQLQRLSGMRPGEVCSMRPHDLDMSGRIRADPPGSHKTGHHGKRRSIYLGPQAQEVLRGWLRPDLGHHSSNTGRWHRNGGIGCARTARYQSNRRNETGPSHPLAMVREGMRESRRIRDESSPGYRTATARGMIPVLPVARSGGPSILRVEPSQERLEPRPEHLGPAEGQVRGAQLIHHFLQRFHRPNRSRGRHDVPPFRQSTPQGVPVTCVQTSVH
jgi:hypothetical protein